MLGSTETHVAKTGCSNMRNNLMCITIHIYFSPPLSHVFVHLDLSKTIKIIHIFRPEKFGFTETNHGSAWGFFFTL